MTCPSDIDSHFTALLKAAEFPNDAVLVGIARMMGTVESLLAGPLSRENIASHDVTTVEYTEALGMAVQQARLDVDAVMESFDDQVTEQGEFLCKGW